ncbi:MAG TPA: TRAM domain-containing protein [Patescibacteria group bacterium]|nr:TRAM domain-containing protein [Patescibacteria group bacterium]
MEPQTVIIQKLVHGGQGMGELSDGRKVFVWGALPGETAKVQVTKSKKSFAEGLAQEIITPSPQRVAAREDNYLATSPWQIVQFAAENGYKKQIVDELFTQAHVALPTYTFISAGDEWNYRNKMEYSFWGDEQGVHLALYNRGSHNKSIVTGSALAMPAIDTAANAVVRELNSRGIRASDLKTIVVRANQHGEAVASLFIKPQSFARLDLPDGVRGLRVYHSNPKSPASVATKLLYELGNTQLTDELLGKTFAYDADAFFQVNLPVFQAALKQIKAHCNAPDVVDMYAGTGSIGLSVATQKVELVEIDPASAKMAETNASASGLEAHVIETPSERAVEYIASDKPVIFDPPRAGLHDRIIDRMLEVLPPQVIYLSCNPATQARDLATLQEAYTIDFFEAYNFFPHTPHIETLAILTRKN